MGICASSQLNIKNGSFTDTAKLVHPDGRLQEFRQPIRARHVTDRSPDHFLCSSEAMYVDSHVPHVGDEEELQLGQLYFLVPASMSQSPLSLQELCSLAVRASKALSSETPRSVVGGVRCGRVDGGADNGLSSTSRF